MREPTASSAFVYVDDAPLATGRRSSRARRAFDIVDDDPAPVMEWLSALAAAIGAKPPRWRMDRFPSPPRGVLPPEA